MKKKILIGVLSIALIYWGLTWFFYGSSHPCGILEARQKPYILAKVKESSSETQKLALSLMQSGPLTSDVVKAATDMLEQSRKAPSEALATLHERIWRLTPAECGWQAVTWRSKQN